MPIKPCIARYSLALKTSSPFFLAMSRLNDDTALVDGVTASSSANQSRVLFDQTPSHSQDLVPYRPSSQIDGESEHVHAWDLVPGRDGETQYASRSEPLPGKPRPWRILCLGKVN